MRDREGTAVGGGARRGEARDADRIEPALEIAVIGYSGLVAILCLMVLKPL